MTLSELMRPPAPLTRVRQQEVLLAALAVVVLEIGVLVGVLPYLTIGRAIMPVSVLAAGVVLLLLGRRAFGRRTTPGHTEPFWVAATIGLAFGAVLLARAHHLIDVVGIGIAAMGEEVVYRFAVPALVAAVLVALKVSTRPARIAGYAVGATWFVLLPWHRAQMTDATQVLPFIAFAALAALVAYRSGSIAATGAVHTVLNMLTVLVYGGDVSRLTRSLALACLLILLVATYGVLSAKRPVPTIAPAVDPAVIDLTTRADAVVIDLRDSVRQPEPEPAPSEPRPNR